MRHPTRENRAWANRSRKALLRLLFLISLLVAIPAAMVWVPSLVRQETVSSSKVTGGSVQARLATAWHIGTLGPDGLRIIPNGRSDASHVLKPSQFSGKAVRHAYWVATQIPVTLNKLYCWCGCENQGVHRSNLQCFEAEMAETCAVCQGTAEIAYQMARAGVQDAGRIQAAVDAKWAPKG